MTITRYLIICAFAAPGLLAALLVASAWIAYREAGRRIDELVDDARTHTELADGCADLGQCGRRLTGDHDDREAGDTHA